MLVFLSHPSRLFLATELALLMLVGPLVLWLALPPFVILPTVCAMALLCYALARASDPVQVTGSWNISAITRANLLPMLRRFALCGTAMLVATYLLAPQMLFGFVREKPLFWALVMVLYPLISVVPQEIVFRRYMFARHARLLPNALAMILVSGAVFGFAHIVFNNWVAPALCAIGGVMFSLTYHKTRSLALVCIEHALYGDLLFTIGLGRYFYHGAVAVAQ